MNNLFENLPLDLTHEVFEKLAGNDNVLIERIVSLGHASPAQGWYQQEKHEWVMVLQGHAVLGYDDRPSVELTPGDQLLIPAGQKHRVESTHPTQETIWLAVHFPPE